MASRHADEIEQQARARRIAATRELRRADEEREAVLDRAGSLASEDLPSGLRGHLASVGARHLVALGDQKAELLLEANAVIEEHDAARARLRSLERVVERLDEAEQLRRRRQEEAELRDLVAARTKWRNP